MPQNSGNKNPAIAGFSVDRSADLVRNRYREIQ